jgi:hypothetical protein
MVVDLSEMSAETEFVTGFPFPTFFVRGDIENRAGHLNRTQKAQESLGEIVFVENPKNL